MREDYEGARGCCRCLSHRRRVRSPGPDRRGRRPRAPLGTRVRSGHCFFSREHSLDQLVALGLDQTPQVRPLDVLGLLRRFDGAGLLTGLGPERDRLFGPPREVGRLARLVAAISDIRLQLAPLAAPLAIGSAIPTGAWKIAHALGFGALIAALVVAASGGHLSGLVDPFHGKSASSNPVLMLVMLYAFAAAALSFRGLMRGLLMRSYGINVRRAGLRIAYAVASLDVDDRERKAASRGERMQLALVGISSLALVSGVAGLVSLMGGHPVWRVVASVSFLLLLIDMTPYMNTDGRHVVGILARVPRMRDRSMSYLLKRALVPHLNRSSEAEGRYILTVTSWLAHAVVTIFVLGEAVMPGALKLLSGIFAVAFGGGSGGLMVLGVLIATLLLLVLLAFGLAFLVLAGAFLKQIAGRTRGDLQVEARVASDAQRASFVEAAPGIPFLSVLPAESLTKLADSLQHESHGPGDPIIREGDAGDRFCFIESGRCVVEITEESGMVHEAAHLGTGDFFGEVALVQPVARTATVRATENVEVLSLAREPFLALLEELGVSGDEVLTQIRNAAFVRNHRFFATVASSQMSDLLGRLKERAVIPGEVVVKQGDTGRTLYLIREGTCAVDHTGADGSTREVAKLATGDHFGEIALLRDGVRTATVRAETGSVLLEVDSDLFRDVMLKNFEAVLQLDQGCSSRLDLLQVL
jgi:CRP-like cAMP-binding protein